jgi:hypothetical protein
VATVLRVAVYARGDAGLAASLTRADLNMPLEQPVTASGKLTFEENVNMTMADKSASNLMFSAALRWLLGVRLS